MLDMVLCDAAISIVLFSHHRDFYSSFFPWGEKWEENLNELREFRKANSHCNVPTGHPENPQLATWVKCQRRQYKLFMQGKPSNMTPDRILRLEEVGFEWALRVKRQPPSAPSSTSSGASQR